MILIFFNTDNSKAKNAIFSNASIPKYDKGDNSNIYVKTVTKKQTNVQNKTPQGIKIANYKVEINSINSIISREIDQIAEPSQVEIVAEQLKNKPKTPQIQSESMDESMNIQDDLIDDFGMLILNPSDNKKEACPPIIFNDED